MSRTILHVLGYIFLCLRDCLSLFNCLNISDEELSKLSKQCKNYFRATALFFRVNPTIWIIGCLVPVHTKNIKNRYGLGIGLNSMEGREDNTSCC